MTLIEAKGQTHQFDGNIYIRVLIPAAENRPEWIATYSVQGFWRAALANGWVTF